MNIEAGSAGNGTTAQPIRPASQHRRHDPLSRTRGRSVVRPAPRYPSGDRDRDRAAIVSLARTPPAAPDDALDWSGVLTQRVR